jgi:anti-sigma-K factor RskA
MSACATHGDLVGGYVLRALEPAEMDAMRRHLAACPSCSGEVSELETLPALLDRIDPDLEAPPAPRPELEEAVLDRFARERGRSRRRQAHRTGGLLRGVAAVAAAALVALALAVLAWPGDGEEEGRAYARAELAALDAGGAARASAYAETVPAGTRVRLEASGLSARRGTVYELWCIRKDGRWVSGGTFSARAGGAARAELTAAVEPGEYHVMVVSRRSPFAGDRTHGTPILRGRLEY